MKNALAAALLLLLSLPAQASPALQGSYTLDRNRSDSIDKAIEKTIAKMSFVLRPIARSRLRKTNPGFETITLGFDGDQARISAGPGAPVVLPMSGAPIRWKRDDGEVFTVRGKLQNGIYTETFEAPDGT